MSEQWSPSGNSLTELKSEEETKKYDHGFSEEDVIRIKRERLELDTKISNGHEVTLEEFKSIIVPYCYINRTEVFNLIPEKVKKEPKEKTPKEPKAPKEKKPKVLKLTKKELKLREERLKTIIMKKAAGLVITDEDNEFMKMMEGEFKK